MERVGGIAPVRRGIGQRSDHLVHLVEAVWPAVIRSSGIERVRDPAHARSGPRIHRSRSDIAQLVQPCSIAPVVDVAPVGDELAHVVEIASVLPPGVSTASGQRTLASRRRRSSRTDASIAISKGSNSGPAIRPALRSLQSVSGRHVAAHSAARLAGRPRRSLYTAFFRTFQRGPGRREQRRRDESMEKLKFMCGPEVIEGVPRSLRASDARSPSADRRRALPVAGRDRAVPEDVETFVADLAPLSGLAGREDVPTPEPSSPRSRSAPRTDPPTLQRASRTTA